MLMIQVEGTLAVTSDTSLIMEAYCDAQVLGARFQVHDLSRPVAHPAGQLSFPFMLRGGGRG